MCAKSLQLCLTLCDPRLFCPWDSPDKNTGVDCHALLPGIFPTQGLNLCLLCLLQWQAGSLLLAAPGRPMLEGSSGQMEDAEISEPLLRKMMDLV